MNDRPVNERLKDFKEVDSGLTSDEAVLEALRCIQCKKPLCIGGCPVGIDIPGFIKLISEREFEKALEVIYNDNLLPAICGRVCPQENQCEGVCILSNKEKGVAIGSLERFVADRALVQKSNRKCSVNPTNKQIAIVGSGPAGLTGAAELAKKGHSVTIFESLHEAGGVLVYGIPEFRLPKWIVKREIEQILSLGVSLKINHLVGKSVSPEELLQFDAVLIATGAGLPHFMGLPGEHLSGVYSANEFLTRVNLMHANDFPKYDTPVKQGSRTVVIGGGNVAMDAARVARRMGAKVTLIYRRRRDDLPARNAEVIRAEEEGVSFVFCSNPIKVLGDEAVTGVECLQMALCEPDESGRPGTEPVPGTNFVIDCDICIQAIGQDPNPLLLQSMPSLKSGKKGTIAVDINGKTSIPHIFAAGDITTGAATVILAMGSAKTAADEIHKMISI